MVVNDSSPDESHVIIERYQARYPNKIKSLIKPNGGLSDARNYGMKHMRGEYFGFVDGDDYVDETMFEKLYDAAMKADAEVTTCDFYWAYPDQLKRQIDGGFVDGDDYVDETMFEKLYDAAMKADAEVTTCDFYWAYPDQLKRQIDGPYHHSKEMLDETMFEKLYDAAMKADAEVTTCDFYWAYPDQLKRQIDGPYHHSKEMLVEMMPTVWNKLYKRSWFETLGIEFPVGLRYEDSSFSIRVAPFIKKIAYVSEPLVYYVQRQDSITYTQNAKVGDMLRYEDSSFSIRVAPFIKKIAYVSEPLVYYVQRQDSITYTQNAKVGDMLTVFYDIFDFYKCHGLEEEYLIFISVMVLRKNIMRSSNI